MLGALVHEAANLLAVELDFARSVRPAHGNNRLSVRAPEQPPFDDGQKAHVSRRPIAETYMEEAAPAAVPAIMRRRSLAAIV